MFTAVPISPVHDATPCSPIFEGEYKNMVGGQMQFYAFEYWHSQVVSVYLPDEDRTIVISSGGDSLAWHGASANEVVSTNLSNEILPEGWIFGDVWEIGDIPDPPRDGVFPYWQSPAQLTEQETTLRTFAPQDVNTEPFPSSEDAPLSNPFVAGGDIWLSGGRAWDWLHSRWVYFPARRLARWSAQVRTALNHWQRIQVAITVDGWQSKYGNTGWKAYMGWCFEGIFANPVVLQAVRVVAKEVLKLYKVPFRYWTNNPSADRKFWVSDYPNGIELGIVEPFMEWWYYTDRTEAQPEHPFSPWYTQIETVACEPTQPYLNPPVWVMYDIIGNGSITPQGRVNPLKLWLAVGSDVTLTLQPADGWHLASVALSGVVIATSPTVQLTDVVQNQLLRVVFQED